MSAIYPFAALRPTPKTAAAVASVPYDVVNSDEARALAASNPLSFLHVSRPEIDLAPGADPHTEAAYEQAARAFARLKADAPLVIEETPSLYVYRLQMGSHVQSGIAACFSIDEYDRDLIKKHEKTRPDKEDDRTRHMIAIGAQTGPVFLTYRASKPVDEVVRRVVEGTPLFDLTAPDGVRHEVWQVPANENQAIVDAFARIDALYIADGHHRAASAARTRRLKSNSAPSTSELRATVDKSAALDSAPSAALDSAPSVALDSAPSAALDSAPSAALDSAPSVALDSAPSAALDSAPSVALESAPSVAQGSVAEADRVLAVAFPDNQMQVLPYNRVVRDLNGLTPEALRQALAQKFVVRNGGPEAPVEKGQLAMYLAGEWHTIAIRTASDALDVDVLETSVLQPLLGIGDVRTDKRIDFVGGIRGTKELEKLVDSGTYAVAFSLYPVSVTDLMRIADAGGIMPPKSTWFEPKLRDGLLSHLI